MSLNKNAKEFVVACETIYGKGATIDRTQIDHVVAVAGCSYPYWLVSKSEYRRDRGTYAVPSVEGDMDTQKTEVANQIQNIALATAPSQTVSVLRQPKLLDESDPAVPTKYPDYVPFGFYKDLLNIVNTNMFYPVFITGHSGNGKTLMVEQICAELKRECIRVNISIETDESDLLGGPTLVDGNVVNRDGPVLLAMKRGAILLIDEVDRGSNKLMCLQGILEGKPYYNKKSGEMVEPKNGFNIIATANTKGNGSDEGKYLAQILDSAFLERFPITVEQDYPDAKTETKILKPLVKDDNFVKCLVTWAEIVRKSFKDDAIDEIISTRRLVHIAKAFHIFGDRMKAIQLCINRFDEDTKTALADLYQKIDEKINPPAPVEKIKPTEDIGEETPL